MILNNFWIILFIYGIFITLSYWTKKQVVVGVTGMIGIIMSLMLLGDAASEFKLLGIVTVFFNVYLFYVAIFGDK